MAEFKVTVNDVKTGKSFQKSFDTDLFLNKKIGDKINGDNLGLKGYELEITGGSDNAGIAIRRDAPGIGRKRPLLTSGVGIRNKRKGKKVRKTVHGNTIDSTVVQVNLKVTKYGSKKVEESLGVAKEEGEQKEAEPKTEAPKEEPVEEKKEEAPKEEKVEEKKEEAPKEEPVEEKKEE